LSLDILGYGGLNDYRKDLILFRDTTIIVRKDNHRFAEIPIKMTKPESGPQRGEPVPGVVRDFLVETRGHRILVSNGKALELVKGETLKIIDVFPPFSRSSGLKVNFKGFVGDRRNNTGEDRGYLINTGSDLMKRYSLNKRGQLFEIIASRGGRKIGRMLVRLSRPKLEYLVLRINGHRYLLLRPEDRVVLSGEDEICLEEIHTNFNTKKGIKVKINGHPIQPGELKALKEICLPHGKNDNEMKVKRGPLLLGKIFIHMK
jgi:hypothetical protein